MTRHDETLNGRYRLIRRLGKGGFGEVWSAHDPVVGRDVAVKLLQPSTVEAADRERFQREVHTGGLLRHAHIVYVLDAGETVLDGKDMFYLVMELVDGEPLRGHLSERIPALRDALRWAEQVCAALEAAHARQVVHRDIKPENIMITTDGTVRVVDFGLAKILDAESGHVTREVVGSEAYMAPERRKGVSDARGDLYSLGCVLAEMCTGLRPFSGPVPGDRRHPLRPSELREGLPASLDSLVLDLLKVRPDARPRDATEVRERLARIIAEAPDLPAVPRAGHGETSAGRPVRRAPHRASVRSGVAAAVGGILLAVTLWGVYADPWRHTEREPPIAAQASVREVPCGADYFEGDAQQFMRRFKTGTAPTPLAPLDGTVDVTLQGRTLQEVLVMDMRITVLARKPLPAGIVVDHGQCGGSVEDRHYVLDLSRTPGTWKTMTEVDRETGERVKTAAFPYKVGPNDPEVLSLGPYGCPTERECRFTLTFDWVADGKRGSTTLDNGGAGYVAVTPDEGHKHYYFEQNGAASTLRPQ
jgi:hypothetical protein